MIEECGEVIAVESGAVVVKVERQSACSRCGAKSMCGTAVIGKMFGTRYNTIRVKTNDRLQLGDDVLLMLPERGLLIATLAVYVLPLVMMLIGALLVSFMSDNDILTALAGCAGLFAGLAAGSILTRQWRSSMLFAPSIKRLYPAMGVAGSP